MTVQPHLHLELEGGIAVVAVRGELDVATSPDVDQAVRERFPAQATALVLDLSEVTFLDSSAVQMLFALHEDLSRSRRALAVVIGHDALPRRSIEICDGNRVLDLEPTREDALRAVGGSQSAV